MKKIAVLITSHNRREKTIACLHALFNCSIPTEHQINIFLVDDGSTDGTAEKVMSTFPSVKIIKGNGDLYWNRGMHLAWSTALKADTYEYFLWLNDDVTLFNTALEQLIITSNALPDSIICGSMCASNNKVTYGGLQKNSRLLTPNGYPQQCNEFNGNCVLIPIYVYKLVGTTDPIFPHAIGDFDYALRAKKKGVESYIAPEFIGFCEKNQSLPKWCLPQTPFITRFKHLYSPLGYAHPYYQFIFENRHYGVLNALKHFLSIHLRAFRPQLWKQ